MYLGKSFSTLWSVFERVLVVGFKKHEPLVLVDLYEEGQEDCWPWGFNTFSTQKLVYLRKSFSTLWSVFERVLAILGPKTRVTRTCQMHTQPRELLALGLSTLSVHKNTCIFESLSVLI